MKRITYFLAVVLLLGACNRNDVPGVMSVGFYNSGCARATKAVNNNFEPTLTLRYTDEGLLILRANAMMNCAMGPEGENVISEVRVQNGIIRYQVYVPEPHVKCMCPVELTTALVSGLQENTEYTLEYSCDDDYRPITFYYAPGLDVTYDLKLYGDPYPYYE